MQTLTSYKTSIISILLTLSTVYAYSQKAIVLNKFYLQTVPDGKVWYISNSKPHTIEFSDGTFESGTSCNAMMHSNPNFFYDIMCYDSLKQNIHNPRVLGFTLTESPIWLHDNVYTVKPYYLIDNNLDERILQYSLSWIYKPNQIVFYPGMRLRTSGCINGFIVYERNMTVKDRSNLMAIKKNEVIAQNRLKQQIIADKKQQQLTKLTKYNDRSSIYSISDAANSKMLFESPRFDTACIMIAKSIVKTNGSSFEKYQDFFRLYSPLKIFVHVKWDSLGRATSFKVDCKQTMGNIFTDSLLRLNASPVIRLDSSRPCLLEGDLIFTCTYSVADTRSYNIKKLKKGYKFIGNNSAQDQPLVINKLQALTLDEGGFYYVTYTKVLLTISFYSHGYDDFNKNTAEKTQVVETDCINSVKTDRWHLYSTQY